MCLKIGWIRKYCFYTLCFSMYLFMINTERGTKASLSSVSEGRQACPNEDTLSRSSFHLLFDVLDGFWKALHKGQLHIPSCLKCFSLFSGCFISFFLSLSFIFSHLLCYCIWVWTLGYQLSDNERLLKASQIVLFGKFVIEQSFCALIQKVWQSMSKVNLYIFWILVSPCSSL